MRPCLLFFPPIPELLTWYEVMRNTHSTSFLQTVIIFISKENASLRKTILINATGYIIPMIFKKKETVLYIITSD